MTIRYVSPSITEREVAYATDAARNCWGDRCYEYIKRFEADFAAFMDVPYAIATSSCTGAIHLGLSGLGIGPGDEVIIADMNWVASVAPIRYLGATPVFVDVLLDSWCIDPECAKAAITPRTKAIVAVHLYGNLCDMDRLLEIGREAGIPVVEDAAEAIGSIYHGRRAGALGAYGTFSFHGTKTITTGEGGMFVTSDRALFERVRTLASHGRAAGETRQFWPSVLGYKYKMSDVQAAIGCAQLERVEELIAGKRRVFARYAEGLAGLPLRLNPEPQGTTNGYWMPSLIAEPRIGFDREALLAQFAANDIDGRVVFWPLSMLPMFERCETNVVSYDIYPRAINLPSATDMTDDEVATVCGVVRRYFGSL